jgi:hypothetical protein
LETEKITKVGAGFIEDSFGLWLLAIIIRTSFIKSTISAAMKVGATYRTLFLPSDKVFEVNFFFTVVANFHSGKIWI